MGDPFTAAAWSMGYGTTPAERPPIRHLDDSKLEMSSRDGSWWGLHLTSSVSVGLVDMQLLPTVPGGSRYWGATGSHAGRSVSIRLPRPLERRDGDAIVDEVLVAVETHATHQSLGRWVVESPPKWFRGRRAWALNRPPFVTGDSWFDEHAGCWAWDCAAGSEALRDALTPLLPAIRRLLDTQSGVIVTDSAASVWIPDPELSLRLPNLLEQTRRLSVQ